MTSFTVEKFADVFEELYPMFLKHKDEVAPYSFFELNINEAFYNKLEGLGNLLTVVAREDNGDAVGYVIYIVSESPHYMDEIYAVMDVIFVEDSHRHTGLASDLVSYAEDLLVKDYGVTMTTIHMKVFKAFEGLATSLGYDKMEYLYTKYVG